MRHNVSHEGNRISSFIKVFVHLYIRIVMEMVVGSLIGSTAWNELAELTPHFALRPVSHEPHISSADHSECKLPS